MARRLKFLLICLALVPITLLLITATSADTSPGPSFGVRVSSLPVSTPASPEPDATSDAGRLVEPPVSDPPTQVEVGHQAYWFSCMVCHGDRGQGLTDEWRNVNPPEDRNCWQSRCHAPNHPPDGFEIPRTAPTVIGTGTLSGFQTAADLNEYLRATMPWPFPNIMTDEQYWGLVAYLGDANRVVLGREPLAPDNAATVLMGLHYAPGQEPNLKLEWVVTLGVLALLLSTLFLHLLSRTR